MRYINIIIFGTITLLSCKKECVKSERCQLAPDPGPGRVYIVKYYYDQEEKKCKEFGWGGYGGVVPFETLEECRACECNN